MTLKLFRYYAAYQFQLTRSRGAWPEGLFSDWWTGYFNSHAHVERDANGLPYSENAGISTHTLTWSVTRIRYIQHWGSKFQLTRSRGAWQYNKKCIDEINNFNSHAHVERDFISAYLSFCHTISTHTLTWSVTLKNSNLQTVTTFQLTRSRGAWLPVFDYSIENIHISTHTLTWSVTSVLQQLEISLHFNSHAHVERDR